jgi:UDP-N-acetyl-D-glucosamine dehydrogenase
MTTFEAQWSKIQNKSAVVGVIGLGYVGLPLILRFAERGFRVIGFDRDQSKLDALAQGKSYLKQFPDSKIASLVASKFEGTTDHARVSETDAIIICVPTPLTKHREPDLSFVVSVIETIVPHLRRGQLISLESTTYPGTTEEVLLPRLSTLGFSLGEELFLTYSPEREDPGNKNFEFKNIPKLCSGITANCLKLGVALYGSVVESVIPMSSTKAAELTKLLENIHRAVNIGLINEMKMVADKMGIDIHEVIRAAATKPFGFVAYYPGPGLGGHCIPIDPFYLTWKAKEFGLHTRFIELAGEINSMMPEYVVQKIAGALNDRRMALNGSRILILGIAYKKNIDDLRESPALDIIKNLQAVGAVVDYSDPHITSYTPEAGVAATLESVALDAAMLAAYDCVVLATDHDQFDYELIRNHSRLIVDSRGRFLEEDPGIVKA